MNCHYEIKTKLSNKDFLLVRTNLLIANMVSYYVNV